MTTRTTAAAATTTFRSDVLADARSVALASAFGALLLVSSCKDRADERAPASVRVAPAPPRPAGLVIELFVPRPLEFWSLLRPLLGPVGELLPQGPELALGTGLGLSPLVATALDLRSPLVGAMAMEGERTGTVLGARLTQGDEFVANLTTGNTPTHRVENEGEVRVLVPVSAGDQVTAAALGVLDHTLLAGARADLRVLGPYVARALTRRAMPEPVSAATFVVTGDALRNSLVPVLRASWGPWRDFLEQGLSRAQSEQGRVADLADPRALLTAIDARADGALAALAGARKLQVRVIPEASRLMLDIEFSTGSASATSFFNVPLDMLSAAPADALVRVSVGRSSVAHPAHLRAGLESLLGPRWTEKDYAAVEAAVTLVEEGRGRAQTFAARADGALVWMGDVLDPKKLEQGLDASAALLQSRSIVLPLASVVGALRVRPGRRSVRGLDAPARAATIELMSTSRAGTPGPSALAPRKLELVWVVRDRDFAVVLAKDAVPLLEAVLDRRAKPASDGALLAPVASAAVAGVVELGALPIFGPPGSGKAIAFALTESPDSWGLRLSASPPALAAITGMRF